MKIGLYTIHASHNVGAMLQAYALTTLLQKRGAEVELVNMYPKAEELQNHHRTKGAFMHNLMREAYLLTHPAIRKMEKNFDAFHEQMPLSKRFLSKKEYMETPNHYDLHLVGSDQVWNLQKGFDFSEFYYLDYLPEGSRKAAYGSSFGTITGITGIGMASRALKSFDKLSVREDTAVDFVKSLTGKSCAHVVDPTLLLTKDEWNEILEEEPFVKGKYIFFYGVNSDAKTWEMIKLAKEKLGIPVVGYPGPIIPKYKFDKYVLNGGPKQFVNLIKNAGLVITSSFHGLAFSVNYGKKFMLVRYGERMGRMSSLMRLVGAQDYFVENIEDEERLFTKGWDIEAIQRNLSIARNKSINWIDENILSI